MAFNNLNPLLRTEVPKWKYNGEDLGAIADAPITEGMCCRLVTSVTGGLHIAPSNVVGEEGVIACGNYATGEMAKWRETGCVGANTGGQAFPIPAGTRMMSDGTGRVVAHANGNYCVGITLWPAAEVNHRVALEVRHFYR